VCHSLGGIIVKRASLPINHCGSRTSSELTIHSPFQALVYSASRTGHKTAHLRSIFVATYGILFLATPHDGSDKAKLGSFAQKLVDSLVPTKVVDTSPQLIASIETGSEVLQEITDNFVPLMKRFCIYFFWEQHKTDFIAKYDYV
jgi:protein SERAC1